MIRFVRSSVFPVLFLCALTASARAAVSYNIADDTYLDNFYVSTVTNGVTTTIDNAHTNYGHGAAVKATSNNGSGSDYPGVNSLTHAVFTLPQTFWTALGTGAVTQPVTVTYYARNPSTATNDASKNPNAIKDASNNTFYRQLEMHPLLQAFTAGTGGSAADTRSGQANTTQGQFGADWYAANTTAAWSTPGGSFDPTFAQSGLLSSATKQFSAITFDVTALLNNAVTRAEVQANGLLIRVTDEGSYTGNEFASLISADSAAAGGSFANYAPRVTITPEPALLGVVGVLTAAGMRQRRSS